MVRRCYFNCRNIWSLYSNWSGQIFQIAQQFILWYFTTSSFHLSKVCQYKALWQSMFNWIKWFHCLWFTIRLVMDQRQPKTSINLALQPYHIYIYIQNNQKIYDIQNTQIFIFNIDLMLAISQRINTLVKTIVFYTKKSKRTFTPKPFNNPQITPLGILTKQPRSYNYNLPQNLPNRHLYWNRTQRNKQLRLRYNKHKLQKLQINPIHDSQGKRLYNRDIPELVAELGSLRVIKQSVGRTIQNIKQAFTRFPDKFLQNGQHADVLTFAIKQIHDRHLPTLNFYNFSTYCQIRYMTKIPPTQTLMLHFYRYLQAARYNKNKKLTIQRLGQIGNYIFSRQYPQSNHLLYKRTPKFQLFSEGQQRFTSIQEILEQLYTPQQIKQEKQKIEQKKLFKTLKYIQKIPGGNKIVEALSSA